MRFFSFCSVSLESLIYLIEPDKTLKMSFKLIQLLEFQVDPWKYNHFPLKFSNVLKTINFKCVFSEIAFKIFLSTAFIQRHLNNQHKISMIKLNVTGK